MARPLGHISIMVSSRVLFDLEEADRVFAEQGPEAYADYMCGRGPWKNDHVKKLGGRQLKPGPLWNFVEAALRLNEQAPGTVEVTFLAKDTAETATPLFRNLDHAGFPIETRHMTSGGELKPEHLGMFKTDLLLTRNPKDAQMAVDMDVAAAVMEFPSSFTYLPNTKGQVHICVDGDAVTFGSDSELVYKNLGLSAYRRSEFNKWAKKLPPGPFTKLLAKISQLNAKFEPGKEPFVISLMTARGREAGARVLTTVQSLGIVMNGGMSFLASASKHDMLCALRPDIFFDDQRVHLESTALDVPAGHVPYKTGAPMHAWLKEQAAKQEAEAAAAAAAAKKTPKPRARKVRS